MPVVLNALQTHKKIRLYYQTAPDLVGLDPGVIWEGFKVGIVHLAHWERVAVVTDMDWIKHTVWLFAFLMPCATKLFSLSDAARAREWILAE